MITQKIGWTIEHEQNTATLFQNPVLENDCFHHSKMDAVFSVFVSENDSWVVVEYTH